MNENNRAAAIQQYIDEITQQLKSGHAREHAYRPALERLMNSFEDTLAVNDPARSENGNPDFVFLKRSNKDIILGYAEAKDITVDLDKTLKTEQLRRYAGYEKLFLTNYRDFIFLASGEEYLRISIAELSDQDILTNREQALHLASELQAFLDKQPEAIRSGKRLAVIMGGKARRIRNNVIQYLEIENESRNIELEKIYNLMKTQLVHDLTKKDFADLYAQTLVYGLFAARYNDESPDNFDRREAVEAVPKTNPFLRQFFNHIAGADFDTRLRYIVDELCEVFSISDIRALVRHQATKFAVDDEQDLTIHFYEDFLKEYDPIMRQKMGVYYTPVPVVRYIVRSVDKILKEEFGITRGLASDETIMHTVDTQPWRKKGERKDRLTKDIEVPRVQILDPAVGTATFLNETIKHIYKDFIGQEGRWPSYVKENLIKRLHGFELMMAPYTIAHLKLSMTLRETGVDDISHRLGVYLTNTLEEGVPTQQDLLSLLGLAGAVSEESQHAADIKTSQPIMIVIGNPPYAVESSNKTKYADSLIDKYRVEPGGNHKLQERNSKMLGDDYVKFIAFAEDMIAKNGSGVVAMITNHGYLDNPTFRGMRWRLSQTFDKIYILDLHGSSKKREKAPDGTKDESVFNITVGTAVMIAIKTSQEKKSQIFHADIFGNRKTKFNFLNEMNINFHSIDVDSKYCFFVPKNKEGQEEYEKGVSVSELMLRHNSGVQTEDDKVLISFDRFQNEYNQPIYYRPFDKRYVNYDLSKVGRPRYELMKNMIDTTNVGLVVKRGFSETSVSSPVFISDLMIDRRYWTRPGMQGAEQLYPLYLVNQDGIREPNFNAVNLKQLLINIDSSPEPEEILDYIYAILNSPGYVKKYAEFLKVEFPRIPIPTQVEFDRLVPLGRELRELHLMKSHVRYSTTFPAEGDNIVEKLVVEFPVTVGQQKAGSGEIEQKMGRVYINDTQYFGNVPELAWSFHIGGYQPAQKWLKDRKGRKLTNADLEHYQKIIKILLETDRIMKQIG